MAGESMALVINAGSPNWLKQAFTGHSTQKREKERFKKAVEVLRKKSLRNCIKVIQKKKKKKGKVSKYRVDS